MERVVAGLQQRRVVTEKEKRILAYHEAGHALLAHLMGDLLPIQKVTIIARGDALGYAYYLPLEERYLHTKEEFLDVMKVALAGRAAEQIVFGRVTNGASNDLEKVTEIARAMVFEYGMSEASPSRTMRADNYALSEETKRLRDSEQARLTDHAYEEAQRLLIKHRASLDRLASQLLERETLNREELQELLGDVGAGVACRPRRSAPCAPACRGVSSPPVASAAVGARGIHHLGVAVHDLDDALDTYERLFGAELEHRARVEEQGVEAAAVLVGSSRVELLAALGEETPVGRFLAEPRPGDAPCRLRGRRRPRGARAALGRRRRADRRGAAAGPLRPPGRIRPSRCRSRRPDRGGVRWLNPIPSASSSLSTAGQASQRS